MDGNIANYYVDTDILIRLFTGDDLRKQEASAKLFEKVFQGKLILSAPETTIGDTVFVLSSRNLYNFPRIKIRDAIASLLRYPNFKVESKQIILSALDLYANSNLDFGDAMLAVLTQQSSEKTIYSYDHDFDKIEGMVRKEP